MERGVIKFNNLELTALHNLATQYASTNQALLAKLAPIADLVVTDQLHEHVVEISEDEAEVLLDSMPIPTTDSPAEITSARLKIQQFLARSRFGEQAN